MRWRLVGVWVVLLLLPAVPVLVFYAVFKDQNYFELNNAARGIVATGPIAAYVALVVMGWRLYKQLSSLFFPLGPFEEKLIGTAWDFTATSYHGTHRKGSLKIAQDARGALSLTGSFKAEDGRDVGAWESTMTHAEDGRLQVVYDLDDLGKGALESSTGMLSLITSPRDRTRMSGTWVVLGRGEAHGAIECRRTDG